MQKHIGYLILNIIGLTIGLTSFLLITIYVLHELSYDRFHKNYENIYRIKVKGVMAGATLDQAITAAPMAETLLADYPEVLKAVRINRSGAWLVKYGENRFNEDGVLFADSSFFSVFDFKLLSGDPKTALSNPRSMILTEKFARKYFGNEDPIGKRISLEADTNLYTVTGVIQNIPANSHFKFDMLGSLNSLGDSRSTEWLNHNYFTYIVLKEGVKKTTMEAKFPEVVLKYVGPQIKKYIGITIEDFQRAGNQFGYELEPLKDIHLKGAPQYQIEPSGSITTVYIFAVIALLILVIAIINYINLATAKSAGRAKEVGIRKVSGSDKTGLILQFVGESLIIVTIATIIASLLVLVITPSFNHLIGKEISLKLFSGKGFIGIIALIVVVGTAAGAYPAFVLASFNPIEVLKGTLNPGSISKTLRGILVVFQFTVSIVIIIGALVVYRQLNFMTSADMGIIKDNLLVIRRPDALDKKLESFKEQILQIPCVEKIANATAIPGTNNFNNNAFFLDNDPTKATYLINQDRVSFGFAEVMGIKLAEGRFFSKEYGTDTTAIMINETAVKFLGLTDPVGKYILRPSNPGKFDKLRIVGVMKDFNIASLHDKITPVCFTLMGGNYEGYLCVRLNGKNIQEVIKSIENVWKDYSNRQPFQYSFFADEFNKNYETEFKTGRIFILFSVLAILIACLGLIGLITYMTTIRTREVGIRKTFGASRRIIVTLLSREVVVLILISSLVAYPVAYFGIKIWLQSFAEKIGVSPIIYIVASIIGLAIGWLSIIYQALKAAAYNPAESLRYK
jgi:ABC-type transport system, involved in lipoprotein release, permease component